MRLTNSQSHCNDFCEIRGDSAIGSELISVNLQEVQVGSFRKAKSTEEVGNSCSLEGFRSTASFGDLINLHTYLTVDMNQTMRVHPAQHCSSVDIWTILRTRIHADGIFYYLPS